jgi:hypothetical protein
MVQQRTISFLKIQACSYLRTCTSQTHILHQQVGFRVDEREERDAWSTTEPYPRFHSLAGARESEEALEAVKGKLWAHPVAI